MIKRLLLLIFIYFGFPNPCFSENKQKMDSLKVLLQKAKEDTVKLNLYLDILQECDFENNLMHTQPALKLVDQLLEKNTNRKLRKRMLKRKIEILDFLIPFYANKGNQEKRLEYDKVQLDIFIELNDTSNIINSLQTLSGIYKSIGNIPRCLTYNQYGINLFKKMNYLKGQEIFMSQLADLYYDSGDTLSGLNKLNEILKINSHLKDSDNIAFTYERIGFIYLDKKDSSAAKVYFKKAIELILAIKKSKYITYMTFARIARIYSSMGDFKNSIRYAKMALEKSQIDDNGNGYSEMLYFNGVIHSWAGDTAQSIYYHKKRNEEVEKNEFYGVNFSYFHLGQIYLHQKKLNEAKLNAYKHLDKCKKVSIVKYTGDAEHLCSRIDSALGNFKDAYQHYKNYISIMNQIKNDEIKLAANREKFQKEADKLKAISKAKQDKKDALAKIENQRKNTILLFVIIGLIAALIFATFIYRSLSIRKKQNKLIENQKTAIESSFKNLEILNNISNEITSSLNLTSVMELIYKNVSSLMDVSFFIISAYNEEENSVEIKYSVKQGKVVEEEFKTSILNPNSYIAKTIQLKKEIIILDEETERSKFLEGPSTLHGKEDVNTKSHIFIPLFIKEKVIGLFSVQSLNKQAYTKTQIDILRSLAPVIAVALSNAEAYYKIDSANVEIIAQKKMVEEKQKEILDSIEYALRIQTAILPPQKIVKQHLENSFILYKPKDIVAGDFYWMETVQLADERISELADVKKRLADETISGLADGKKRLADERNSGLVDEKNIQLADERISGLADGKKRLADEKNIQLADERISGLADGKKRLADETISGLTNEKNSQLADETISGLANEKNSQLADERISELANENKLKNNQLINSSANQLILFAACDCTGHGVPGAMVSVVCHNALNRAVHEFGLTSPATILDKTAEIVVENFSKSEEEIKDGMDISLCALNFKKVQNDIEVELQWAGANNPLWLIRNGEFEETKADKQPIGMNEDHHPFTNHSFTLKSGDTIYIFSDGYADQFSPADKKLMKKNFKNVLLGIQDKSMQEQHQFLNEYIENWKGNMEQTDDILVIGVRV
jgi:serine phosphatase RsbU (regulator of sigma subunit)